MIEYFMPRLSRGFSWFLFALGCCIGFIADRCFVSSPIPTKLLPAMVLFAVLTHSLYIPWVLVLIGRIERTSAANSCAATWPNWDEYVVKDQD